MGEETKEATQKWTAVAVFGLAFPYRLCLNCPSHEARLKHEREGAPELKREEHAGQFLLFYVILAVNPHQINPSSLYLYIPRLGLSKKCYQCIRADCDCSAAPDFRKEAGNLKLSIYLLKVTTTSNTSKSRFCNKSSRNKGSSIDRVRWQLVKCTDVGRLVCHARLLGHFVWIRNVVTK